jgi:hypothetical protein
MDQKTEEPGFNFQQRQNTFFPSTASRPAVGPIQLPIQWVLVANSHGGSDQAMKLTETFT